ncbi:hypothetical protein ACSMXN_09370 [Jatrophihabitans sp. DSM 45814]
MSAAPARPRLTLPALLEQLVEATSADDVMVIGVRAIESHYQFAKVYCRVCPGSHSLKTLIGLCGHVRRTLPNGPGNPERWHQHTLTDFAVGE